MRATSTLVALALVLATTQISDARSRRRRNKGRVVRVERNKNIVRKVLRMCANPRSDGGATCYGIPPRIDEPATIIDETGTRATGRVATITPVPDRCGNQATFDVILKVDNGDVSQVSWSGAMLFDYDVTSRTRVIQGAYGSLPLTSPRIGEQLLSSIDDDGDDVADLLVTWYFCDQSTAVSQTQSGHYCIAYYKRDGGSYSETRVDFVNQCY